MTKAKSFEPFAGAGLELDLSAGCCLTALLLFWLTAETFVILLIPG